VAGFQGFQPAPKCPLHPTNIYNAIQSPFGSFSPSVYPQPVFHAQRSFQMDRRSHGRELRSSLIRVSSAVDEQVEVSEAEKAEKKAKRQSDSGKSIEVHVIGLSHHHASVEVREKLAVPEAEWNAVSSQLVEMDGVQEAAILSTCNRFEVYVGAHNTNEAIRDTVQFLSKRSGIPAHELRQSLFMLGGEDAVWHLMRVSGGLDSLVVGEGQILSQVRQCYLHSSNVEEGGQGGKVTSRLLNNALAAGKRVRAETAISKGAVSISSAAVEFCNMKGESTIGKEFLDSNVVIIGAGKMTKLLITHMSSLGVNKVTVLNRNVDNAKVLIEEYPDVEFELLPMTEMWSALHKADFAFTSTSSPDCILTKQNLAENKLGQNKPIFLVDISVPRNIEGGSSEVEGVHAFDVDDLKQVVARNTAMRRKQVLEAEELLREEMDSFLGWQRSLDAIPTINQLQVRAEEMRMAELSKAMKKLKDLESKEMKAVDQFSKGIVKKLLHGPMTQLRVQESPDKKKATLENVKDMFDLNGL